jgi:drug/metabolite transporter (DMT)-like permease
VFIKRYSKYEDPVVISGYQFFIGGIFMVIVGLIFGGRILLTSFSAILVLLYLGMLSAVAYSLWGVLLKYNSVSRVTIFSFMTPVFGTVLSKLMLKENAAVSTLNLVITLLLVCLGIFLINYQKKPKKIEVSKDAQD